MRTLPDKIELAAMKKSWKVCYVETPGKLILIEHSHRVLGVYGKKYSKRAAISLIKRWVKLKAHCHLSRMVKKMNHRVKAKYKKINIGSHKAQWGSYSSAKTISLNYKLIFLSPSFVKHIIIHELCHDRIMNHSHEFWNLVKRYDKSWKRHREMMNHADTYLPVWVSKKLKR